MDNWRNNTIWFEQIPDNLQAYLYRLKSNYLYRGAGAKTVTRNIELFILSNLGLRS
jgi:hypothetical protein